MLQDPSTSRVLTRTTLAVLLILALIVSTAWIVRPFLSVFLWATMIVISTWPLLLRVQARVGGRRGLATAVMTAGLLLTLLIPLSLLIGVLIINMDRFVALAESLGKFTVPPPPDWLARIPVEGPKLSAEWRQLSAEGPAILSTKVVPLADRSLERFATRIGSLGAMILQFFLTVVFSGVLYLNGETAARRVRRFLYGLAGPNGDRAAILAANTVRSVAIGIVVTAGVQALITGMGLVVASVPAPGLLTAVSLILCVAQIGPMLVMLPAIVWKFYTGDIVWGCVLAAFLVAAITIDNVLRPLLIRKGSDLPLLLIFVGVVGGIMSFGVMGIFVGPVILAVAYDLMKEWVEIQPESEEDVAPDSLSEADLHG